MSGTLDRLVEIQMQFFQPSQHIGGFVSEMPLTPVAVVPVIDSQVSESGQYAFDADAHLRSGERRARACVRATPESKVVLATGAIDIECLWLRESSRVAVDGEIGDHDRSSRRDGHAAHRRRSAAQAMTGLDRSFVTKDFFNEV